MDNNAAFFNEYDCNQYNIWLFFIFIFIQYFFINDHAEYLCTWSLPMIKIILPKMQFEFWSA